MLEMSGKNMRAVNFLRRLLGCTCKPTQKIAQQTVLPEFLDAAEFPTEEASSQLE